MEGAKVKTDNEVEKMPKNAEKVGLEAFQEASLEEQKKKLVPLASDREIIRNVSPELLAELQKERRLVGYDPKGSVALVLKKEFMTKKKAAEKK